MTSARTSSRGFSPGFRAHRRIAASVALVVALFTGGTALPASAAIAQRSVPTAMDMPAAVGFSPTDESKVPHYFGPYPNWANTPQVLADAVVALIGGGGTGAEATATVNPRTGGIDAVTVTAPGTGYTSPPDVAITAAGVTPTAAAAVADISLGVLTSITVDEAGFGFVAPTVSVTGGNATVPAQALASGGVDNLTITAPGSGYAIQPIVQLSLPDLADGTPATAAATMDASGAVTAVEVVDSGSGYTQAPTVTVLDGDQVVADEAVVEATIGIARIDLTLGGEGYDSAPLVTVMDTVGPPDKGASATAAVAVKGAVTGITVTTPGAGYLTPGLRKFVDTLPGLGEGSANDLGQYIPVAVPDTTTYPGSDYYEIAVVQYRMKFHRDLPASLLRGYVQLSTSAVPGKQLPLSNANLDPAMAAAPIDGFTGVDIPHYMGPMIVATKDRPVRILFRNLLPTGSSGDLFLPVDTSMMGAGEGPDMMMLNADGTPMDMTPDEGTVTDAVRNPACGQSPKPAECFSENRATVHMHGGITPWISDGTPHQWITPAGEDTAYPQGVSVSNVPDMPDPGPGAQTFFYTNQQSARLMFFHDHSWGITRLNVYAGEAAPYLITDQMEQSLMAPGGALEGLGTGTPLIIQDKTFLPDAATVAATDPTWNYDRWGGEGNLWAPHVYMPAQNPSDPGGMSSFGRWMYGPWFWPPANNVKYPPIANPYFDPMCDPDVEPFCEPAQIPSTPNVSVGMEAFNDTPIVNGTAYPTTTVDPKAYRYRILNAANDRFWNLSWYVADPTTGTLSEVALKASEVDAAQTDPVVFPTPDTTLSPKGPSWVQIGSEGGFLPQPTVIPAHETTWITDPTRFDVGNVDQHSLLLAPAERADVVVDFSQYRGKTLILYNDAPAAFPARVPGYDYYTGGPDLSPAGAPTTLPGYGPNTRTIMQVKVSAAAPALAWDRPSTTNDRMGRLMASFAHHADGSGVFESSQNPIVVGQAAYNSTLGTNFVSSGFCDSPVNPSASCDGYARIQQQGGDSFSFDTVSGTRVSIPLQPKSIHDEMNSANFDLWGRMSGNLGLEAPGATPLTQNIILYPYVNPATEVLDPSGLPSSLDVTPISTSDDGTQIWKITHNGVDTHPIHFHLYDIQVINRVTWDNIIIPPEANELGWKDTVRVSPLEDTIVAVRPIVPSIPFGVPDSKRPLNPMMPLGARGSQNGANGSEAGFNNTDAAGNPIDPIVNEVVDFGWEYVWHCHILSHEEMDMMRPQSVLVRSALPQAPALTFTRQVVNLAWTDGTPVDYTDPTTWTRDGTAEVGYRVERAEVVGGQVQAFGAIASPLANATAYADTLLDPTLTYQYRVIAWNEAGEASSNVVTVEGLPSAPVNLTAVVEPDPTLPSGSAVLVGWTNTAPTATSTLVERAAGTGAFVTVATLAPTDTSYRDVDVVPGAYAYRVSAVSPVGQSLPAGPVSVTVAAATAGLTLVDTPDPTTVGADVTFTATVAGTASTAVPTGTVTFTVAGVVTPVALDATGTATLHTPALPVGITTVTADYAGDGIYAPASASADHTVLVIGSTTALVSSANPSVLGAPVTFTATVSPSSATGTVQLVVDGAPLGAPVVLAGGQAVFTTAALTAGGHTVAAAYSGDATHGPSSSPTLTQSVNLPLRATSTTVTSNRVPAAAFGQSVTFTAAVARVSGTGVPTGSVQFVVDGVPGATVTLNNQGRAAWATTGLTAGTHTVQALYGGSAVFATSASVPYTQVVNRRATVTSVTSNRATAVSGQSVTLTARVAPTGATGSVQFLVDGSPSGAPVALDATGRARLTTSSLTVGSHSVVATYLGDANHSGSASTARTQVVTTGQTRTVVVSSNTRVTAGTTVVFTVTVTPIRGAVGVATGTVQLTVDGNPLGAPVPLNAAGQAAYATNALSVGTHVVSAQYSGDGAFAPSASAGVTQRVR